MSIGNKIMSKQSSRNHQKLKGGLKVKLKLKHGLQTCLLLAICIWLLYQLKQSYTKNALPLQIQQNGREVLKLGRKDLTPLMDVEISTEFDNGGLEEEEEGTKKLRENKQEITDSGDDEHNEEKVEEEEEPEQLEDLIDEDDDGDSKEENAGLLNNQDPGEVEMNSEKARVELYEGDVIHNIQSIIGENQLVV